MTKRASLRDALHSQKQPKSVAPSPNPSALRRQLSIRLDREVIQQLKLIAVQEDKTLQDLVCEGLNAVFQGRGQPPIAR